MSYVLVVAVLIAAGVTVVQRFRVPSTPSDVMSVVRNGRTVTFVSCPKCEMRARISADATTATVNASRLDDGAPSPEELERRRRKILDRVFAVMEEAASANGAFWGDGLAAVWRTNGAPVRAIEKDVSCEVLVRDIGPGVAELAIYNLSDAPRDFSVPLASVGLSSHAEAIDLTERAIPPDFENAVAALVAPNDARIYRLSASAGKWKHANREQSK